MRDDFTPDAYYATSLAIENDEPINKPSTPAGSQGLLSSHFKDPGENLQVLA